MSFGREALPLTSIQGFLHGFVAGGGNNGLILDQMIVAAPAQIRLAIAAAAAGGGSPTTLDVRINDSSVWHNAADRPTLAAGKTGRFASGRINKSALQPGDVLTLLIVTAGGGSQITATVVLEDPSQRGG